MIPPQVRSLAESLRAKATQGDIKSAFELKTNVLVLAKQRSTRSSPRSTQHSSEMSGAQVSWPEQWPTRPLEYLDPQ